MPSKLSRLLRCVPTYASALGLFSVVSAFPGGGFWFKLVGAVLLSYSAVKTYRGLDHCAVPKKIRT